MSTEAPVAPVGAASAKVNLRRPDVMEEVQAQVVAHYRSSLVERIRANGGVLSSGNLTVKLAKQFGFCYGVERAIDLAYAARKVFPPPRPIFLLGEIIHNPEVNDQIRGSGHSEHSAPSDGEDAWRGSSAGTWSSFRRSGRRCRPGAPSRRRAVCWWTPPVAT